MDNRLDAAVSIATVLNGIGRDFCFLVDFTAVTVACNRSVGNDRMYSADSCESKNLIED